MVEEIRTGGEHEWVPNSEQAIPGENVKGVYPLSPLQEGMLFHRLLNEAGDTYVLAILFEAGSREHIDRLARALQKVIDRHDLLRTAIVWSDVPRPVQVVYRRAALPVEPLRIDPARDVLDQLNELMRPGAERLDFNRAPLMILQTVADPRTERWYALLHVHHVVCDHESLNTIVAETRCFLDGRDRELPQPVDFHEHAQRMCRDAPTPEVEAFFRRKLEDFAEPAAPFGLVAAHGGGAAIEESRQLLTAQVAARICAWSDRLGVTPARLFHAAWGLVVAHTSGRSDVVFGTVLLADRAASDRSRNSVGLSVNTLPVRLRLDRQTVRDFLGQTQRELSDLMQHAHASLADVQRCAGTSGRVPLFSALLNYRHNRRGRVTEAFNTKEVRIAARAGAWTNYPITMTVDDLDSEFVLTCGTDRRIAPQQFINYLQEALRSMIDALEHAPQAPVMALNVVPAAELDRILRSFNVTAAPYAREKLIHELFEEQARRTPDQMAVAHGGESLTYAELDRKSDLIANLLRARGVGPDKLVGVYVERSIEMIVGVLGTLKAGGAYLPLDPSYPPDRVKYVLDDARPVLVLTQQALRARLPETSSLVIVLDERPQESLAVSGAGAPPLHQTPTPSNLLYVIYTSGSTGRPKGTAMPHLSMVNLIERHRRELPLRHGAAVLQFAALSFDVAFQEIFSTLCAGGALVLVDDLVGKDPRSVMELLQAHRVERLFVPPMMLQALADYATTTAATAPDLKDVITERLRVSPEIVSFFERLPGCRLHNSYGSAETNFVTCATLEDPPQGWLASPPIGKPIANTRIYILDAHRRPVPFGASGEIYIAGDNLARGYLNRPELSCDKFVVDPFGPDSGARMYRTGDMGRWLSDGQIEYLGPRGKPDRRNLPAPAAAADVHEYEAPQSDSEKTLAEIWTDLLRVSCVGRNDNFFDLGGHSILAMQTVTRFARACRSIFQSS